MDPISIATTGIAFVGAAASMAQSCIQLYEFWESMQDAPAAVQVIKNDLMLLARVLKDLSVEVDLSPAVTFTLDACKVKVDELKKIVEALDPESLIGTQKRERLWAKFRMTSKLKQLESFRQSLSEVRSTLMLGLMYQNIQQPRLCFTNQDVQIVQVCASQTADTKAQLSNPVLTRNSPVGDTFAAQNQTPTEWQNSQDSPPAYSPMGNGSTASNPSPTQLEKPPAAPSAMVPRHNDNSMAAIASSPMVQKFLQRSLHLAVDDLFASGTVEQLMSSSLNQVTSFDTAYDGSYSSESYNVNKVFNSDEKPSPKSKGGFEDTPGKGPRLSRSKVCHQKSSIGVVLGSIWIRTSTLKVSGDSSITSGQLEVITSFIFYPASWLTKFGLRYGTEANLQWSPTSGWNFNVSAIRAVPENSLIFDMCRDGNVLGVERMLARGDASVKDTSPKGWTPLHFAAASGHVDLCAALIGKGAEKQALAFEGPTEDALSPLAIWSEYCQAIPASEKIAMLRLFGNECMDISEINGDGWVVGHNLIAHMAKEQTDMSQTSVHWVYSQKQAEILVSLGASSVWHGVQQAVRAFLHEENENKIIYQFLHSEKAKDDLVYQSHVSSLGHWLALRASQRDLLPVTMQACQFIQVAGFDPFPGMDGLGKRDLNRALPMIYKTWTKLSGKAIGNAKSLVEAELDVILGELAMDREALALAIQAACSEPSSEAPVSTQKCLKCGDDYAKLGTGLVQPVHISFEECRATKHKFYCECVEYLHAKGVTTTDPAAESADDEEEDDVDEEFLKEVEVNVDDLCAEYDKLDIKDDTVRGDPFKDAATMLYRAQGRRWIGTYDDDEVLCAACFLKREEYLEEDGSTGGARFTPAPKTFVSACPSDTFDANYNI